MRPTIIEIHAQPPYRLEVVEDVHQPVLQAEPERLTRMLLEHLSEHARWTASPPSGA